MIDRSEFGKNKREMRVYSAIRFGHHGIINWIVHHFENNKVCYFDSLEPKQDTIYTKPNLKRYCKTRASYNSNSPTQPYFDESNFKQLSMQDFIRMDKECLIHSYQKMITRREVRDIHKQYNGKSEEVRDIVIIRDPYNHLASKFVGKKIISRYAKNQISHIKKFYKEALSHKVLPNGIVINYNQWVLSEEYRQSVSTKLCIKFSDVGLKVMATCGSSFDGMFYDGKADEMKVLNRWRNVCKKKWFGIVMADDELTQITKQLFTPEYVNKVKTVYKKLRKLSK